MLEEFTFLLSGIIFGLTLGVSPGPLLTLVISETLKHNRKEGIKVAIAPIITDLPIVLITLLILSKISNFDPILGSISILGAIFIGYLAYENIFTKRVELNIQDVKPQSLKRGIIANFLSPHPYIFWFIIGAPTVLKALGISLFSSLSFILGFYVFLVGSKIFIATVVEKSRSFLKSDIYVYAIKFLGILLLIFSLMFLMEGLRFFGVI
jgi:threonine/homoserine/homoserine lactone efflux protein